VRRRKREDPSLFYIQVHPKHFSTATTVERPTIDIVRAKGRGKKRKPERVRLMFPRTMEVIEGTFEVKCTPLPLEQPIGFPLYPSEIMPQGGGQVQLSARVCIGRQIFKLTMEQEAT